MPVWLMIASAVAGWLGAVTGSLALWINWLNRRDTVRERVREKIRTRPWAEMHEGVVSDGAVRFRVTIHHRGNEAFRISRLRIVKPRGAEIGTTYTPAGAKDWPAGTREASVDWSVIASTVSRQHFVGAAEDIWIRVPKAGPTLLSSMLGSTRRQRLYKIVLSGETSPPMRDPLRVTARATIAP
ncbi:MAG: hypothetical protein Q7T93_16465 [Methylobacterium sp.]|uniref:hypothetical protein n=1 Tax=Methylobacterium sp. TaxID=409 RepID=UPI0027269EB6|nr:hypothetical protein [Methylobacterium sp.]MDO9428411.1 hypothetical protein [Methylobacterium sp.]